MSLHIPERDAKYLSDNGFDVVRLIHLGKYGTVFLANCNRNAIRYIESGDQWVMAGKQCAIKMVNTRRRTGSHHQFDVRRELELLTPLNHRHVVGIFDAVMSDNQRLYIITEYSQIGTLKQFMRKCLDYSRNFKETKVRSYIKQLISGLKYLHDNGVIHGDIRLGHVLLFEVNDPILKYVDFGAASLRGETVTDKPQWIKRDVEKLSRIFSLMIGMTNGSEQAIGELEQFARSMRTQLTVNDVIRQHPWVASN